VLIAGAVLGRRSLSGRATGGDGGCEGPDYRAEKTGKVNQAVDIGQVASGAQAALTVVSMITTVAKYGELRITNNMIYDKITAVQGSLDTLTTKADAIALAQKETNANIFTAETTGLLSAVKILFQHYISLKGSNPEQLPTFYANLLTGTPDGLATLNLADLDTLSILGQKAIPYLASLYGGAGSSAAAIAATNDLGDYAASLQLRISQGFYLLALAKQEQAKDAGADPDFAPQGTAVAANEARLSTLGDTFVAANHRMNELVVGAARAARQAAIGTCYADYCYFCAQTWSFNDTSSKVGKYSYTNTKDSSYRFALDSCEAARASYFVTAVAETGRDTMQALLTGQPAFTHWTDTDGAAGGGAATIRIKRATYGTSDVTSFVRSATDHRTAVAYPVSVQTLGDPQPSVAKDFSVEWVCGSSVASQTVSFPAEANGKLANVTCAPMDLGDLVGAWKSFQDPTPYQGNPGIMTAKLTAVDANTLRLTRGDGVSFSLNRSADPMVLDVGKDYVLYSAGMTTGTLATDNLRKVDRIIFPGMGLTYNLTYRRDL
jgi:hypothetical protein